MSKLIVKDAEMRLVEMTGSLKSESSTWRAVHFHFSELLEHYKSDYQLKIAVNLITALLKEHESYVYLCGNSDIFVLAKGAAKLLLEKMVFQLRYLFMDDPLAYNADGQENPDFSTLYDLSIDWQDFMNTTRKRFGFASKADTPEKMDRLATAAMKEGLQKKAEAKIKAASMPVSSHPQPKILKPMTASRLVAIERDILPADLSRVIRKQPICAVQPGKPARRVFDELYINIAHLRQLVMAEVDFLSNRWLFKYLTQVLDEKVLDLLERNSARYCDMPVSINLNVATLLSEKFLEFDAAIKPNIKVSIVLELNVADVFADMEAFMIAKETVQKLGYRVCLDGLTALSFSQVDRERLGFDLAKLQWNASAVTELDSVENRSIVQAVKRCGANRIILCRCDTQQALDYGHAMGISLFQGRHLDKTINPNAKMEN